MRWPLGVMAFCIIALAALPTREAVTPSMRVENSVTNWSWSPASVGKSELNCLTNNIYYEARSESPRGQLAVAYVTLNRLRSPGFGRTICDVVFQKDAFTWTRDRDELDGEDIDEQAWLLAELIGRLAVAGLAEDPTNGATDFHAVHIKPTWSADKIATTQIGHHKFYTRRPRVRLRSAR